MKDLVRILIAPLVWLAAFSAVYGLHGVICGFAVDGTVFGLSLARVLLVTAYVLAILVQVVLLWALYQDRFSSASVFVNFVGRASGWVGVIAAVWTMLPAVLTTYCG
ncbi:hypothetical protein [Yoonia vestfoldensis]|uniref:hypothetical protein n=1 Tax=Yoonia vestfoldensis TaxID=245188 RepID=UPI0003610083|nr:hypothetical protein [Yoonia vestfoldensis]